MVKELNKQSDDSEFNSCWVPHTSVFVLAQQNIENDKY